jgi:hypothetical protein
VSWWLERLPLAVLILCVAFLQGFALTFWHELLGRAGWGVSVGLEVLHLWFWFRAATSARYVRAGWLVLAVLATALLLAGTLHEVTRPLMEQAGVEQSVARQRQTLESEEQVLRSNLAAFRDMAADQERRGWQADIRRDTARLQEVMGELRGLAADAGSASRWPWLTQVTQLGVIAVAVLFQLGAVLALWGLSGGARNVPAPVSAPATPNPQPERVSESISETFPSPEAPSQRVFYARLWRAIETHARSNRARFARGNGKLSQAALATDLGINAPDLSGIKLLARGEKVPRNPAREAVERLAERFGIETP